MDEPSSATGEVETPGRPTPPAAPPRRAAPASAAWLGNRSAAPVAVEPSPRRRGRLRGLAFLLPAALAGGALAYGLYHATTASERAALDPAGEAPHPGRVERIIAPGSDLARVLRERAKQAAKPEAPSPPAVASAEPPAPAAAEPPAPTAVESPAAAAGSAAPDSGAGYVPLTAIERITAEERRSETVVTLWGNGRFNPRRLTQLRIPADPPREVFKIRGVTRPLRPAEVPVHTWQVGAIRTGLHLENGEPELHVVLDLAGPWVVVTSVEVDGDRLHIHLTGE